MAKVPVQFTLNGAEQAQFVESGATLLSVLRDRVGDHSAKSGCGQGGCGACSVLIGGELKLACLIPAETCEGAEIETLAGLSQEGGMHPLQKAFLDTFATQCGFCTPGMIMAAKALLDRNPAPTRGEVVEAISGNICRCTGYETIISAILSVADQNAAATA